MEAVNVGAGGALVFVAVRGKAGRAVGLHADTRSRQRSASPRRIDILVGRYLDGSNIIGAIILPCGKLTPGLIVAFWALPEIGTDVTASSLYHNDSRKTFIVRE
jgi:hypothetical protein